MAGGRLIAINVWKASLLLIQSLTLDGARAQNGYICPTVRSSALSYEEQYFLWRMVPELVRSNHKTLTLMILCRRQNGDFRTP